MVANRYGTPVRVRNFSLIWNLNLKINNYFIHRWHSSLWTLKTGQHFHGCCGWLFCHEKGLGWNGQCHEKGTKTLFNTFGMSVSFYIPTFSFQSISQAIVPQINPIFLPKLFTWIWIEKKTSCRSWLISSLFCFGSWCVQKISNYVNVVFWLNSYLLDTNWCKSDV